MGRVLSHLIQMPEIEYFDENSNEPVGNVEFSHSKLFHPAIIEAANNPSEDEPKTRPLQPHEMKEWNMFLDFVKQKGLEGSSELNKRNKNLGQSLFDEFKKSNPGITINYDIVPSVQAEMQKLQKTAQDFAKRHGDKNAENIMTGISPIDSWFGSKTSQFRFPEMTEQQFHNDALVKQHNLGLVNSQLQPTGNGATIRKQIIPKGVKLEQMYDSAGNKSGMGYTDPDSGDIQIVNQ